MVGALIGVKVYSLIKGYWSLWVAKSLYCGLGFRVWCFRVMYLGLEEVPNKLENLKIEGF